MRRYAKRSENITRNKMIVDMWRDTNKSLKQIADVFNVSYGTVLNTVHKHVEYDHDTYKLLLAVNEQSELCRYSQAVVTRAWLALKRWYPAAAESREVFKQLTFGADVDNNERISKAVETLLDSAQTYLRGEGGLFSED